ncbi:Bax inhibitor-1 family protein [Teredinibacter sp. KSP-S5-2]|uniref:Bax inhibitor-1 family protein n=1 Tax=Teredinibacter sp. KSP-S5-2 TaxID=3034506 RepID=UPI002934D7BA|nr:Bax inhibitor-1 family protein [Teredinibacter sp. KSP-S5-2]WNO10918.1 Bax inhibitor-1 family protein [Teredinibacter sp. KSP-S5-2]
MQELYSQTGAASHSQEVSKVLRNTYAMLAMTLVVSALSAGAAMAIGIGHGMALIFNIVAIGMLWFVLPRTANSAAGVWVVFGFTALLGAGLGPMLSHYLAMPNGSAIVMQALGATALVFFALSGYVLTTGKDFSFLGGFLFVGLVVVLLAAVGSMIAGFFGVAISGVMLAINAAIVFLMSGFILYDTSRIIHGGERNYLMATVALYLDILNLFTSLLHLIGAFSGDD